MCSLVSSAVERQPFKLVVEGSIPSWGELFFLKLIIFIILNESNRIPFLFKKIIMKGFNEKYKPNFKLKNKIKKHYIAYLNFVF